MEYQKMIDQTTRFYTTLYLGLVAFFATHIMPFSVNSAVYLTIAGALLIVVAATWRWKIDSWNQLLNADIKYNKCKTEGYREYSEFIQNELEKVKTLKKKKAVLYPNFSDDILPRILLMVSFMVAFAGLVIILVPSTINVIKLFK